MPRGFEWWLGGIDLNEPMYEDAGAGTSTAATGAEPMSENTGTGPSTATAGVAETMRGHGVAEEVDVAAAGVAPSDTGANARSGARTGITLSSEDSASDGEV
jgi:hypothetical protein